MKALGARVLEVFPAYAGMSLLPLAPGIAFASFPRLRGDEPS